MSVHRQNLVLVPGLLCTPALFAPQAAALSDVANITIAEHTRHETMAAIAADILANAPATFALGGLSMGGYIALEIMRQAPERVTRLALMDTSARADPPEVIDFRRRLLDLADHGKFRGVTSRLLPTLIHESRLDDQLLVETVFKMAEDTGVEAFKRQQAAIMGRVDSRDLLARIVCPTVIIVGREDARTPLELHEEMAREIPGARLEIIERCGHLTSLERPDEVNAILRAWLGPSIPGA